MSRLVTNADDQAPDLNSSFQSIGDWLDVTPVSPIWGVAMSLPPQRKARRPWRGRRA